MSEAQDSVAVSSGRPLEPLKKTLTKAIDSAVLMRWEPAKARAACARGSTVEEQVADVRRMFARELATVGAVTGGVAAVPGLGTAVAAGTLAGELGWINLRMVDLLLTIAVLHGHGEASVKERRGWLTAVLLAGTGSAQQVDRLASEVGKGLGKKATRKVPVESLRAINHFLGRTVIVKNGVVQGAVRLGTVLPLGIGACIGAGGNYLTVTAMARHANRYFGLLSGNEGAPSSVM